MAEHHTEAQQAEHAAAGEHHFVPLRVYLWNFTALMVLLVATLFAAYFDLGQLNLLIAVTIAVIKAMLVVLFFMHLAYSTRLVQVFAGAALFWLVILFALMLGDYLARRGPQLPGGT